MEEAGVRVGLERMQWMFNEIQRSDVKTYSELVNGVVQLLSGDCALEDFCSIVDTVLVCKRATIPSKVTSFLKRIFEDLYGTPGGLQTVLGVFSYLTRLTESRTVRVRKNALSILRLMTELPQIQGTVTDAFLSKICERLFDKEKSVRKEALRMLSEHQDVRLNAKIKVVSLFKDIVRHDPSHEVRRFGLNVISIEMGTYSCMIERCVDTNEAVRKTFYTRCLPLIDLRDVSLERRVFVMEKSILEREFDGRSLFLDVLFSTYRLPEDLRVLTSSFYERRSVKYLEMMLRGIFERVGCERSFEYLLAEPSEEDTFLAMVSLQYMEESSGRDGLNLPDLEEFVGVMYRSCLEVVEDSDVCSRQSKVERMKNLFRIVRFYDFFNETARKYILSTVYKLLAKNPIEEVVEEAVQIVGQVCDRDLNEFVGSVIKRNMGESLRMCLVVCKHVMKHIRPVTDLHEAIINEIVLQNIDSEETRTEVLEIGFYYIMDRPHNTIIQTLVSSMRMNTRILHMCVDLAIASSNEDVVAGVLEHVERMMTDGNEDGVIPASKLILSSLVTTKESKHRFVRLILEMYYNTQDDHLKQYCSVFFFELFMEDSSALIDVFCEVVDALGHSHRIFVDQSLYWICNSKHRNGSQELFYRICVHLCNGGDGSTGRRMLVGTLERIEIMGCWDTRLTKKILFCCSVMTRRLGNRLNIGGMIGRVMEVDDGEPIGQEDLWDVKADLNMN